jgi:hypothetical protein
MQNSTFNLHNATTQLAGLILTSPLMLSAIVAAA